MHAHVKWTKDYFFPPFAFVCINGCVQNIKVNYIVIILIKHTIENSWMLQLQAVMHEHTNYRKNLQHVAVCSKDRNFKGIGGRHSAQMIQ